MTGEWISMPGPTLVYIAGPYTAPTLDEVEDNIAAAVEYGQFARALGYVPLVPHVAILPLDDSPEDYEQAMVECFALILRADALLMMPNWRESPGAVRERALAERIGLPVFGSPAELAGSIMVVKDCHKDPANPLASEIQGGKP